ncbi:MAG: DNA polymerase I [Clostridia bacterium]|nr:DNA polymerase I [Clostridia bacterium]
MDKMVLVDGYSLMYRAYHALQSPMSAPDGTPTNAVHGFVMMLLKVIGEEKPEGIAVAFDMHAPTFRSGIFDGYKATRKPMPDDLRAQDPIIREIIGLMGIPILECEGYEADDILGTVSRVCEEKGQEVLLVTGDRDSFQLSGENTTILYTKRGITDTQRVTPDYIRETYGVEPRQLIDVKSLMGDASDNIPGVSGVGEKTALRLIQTYGSLEDTLRRADAEEKGKLRERLLTGAEQARMSRKLAEIVRNAPVEMDFENWKICSLGNAVSRLKELGMNLASRKLAELAAEACPEAAPVAGPAAREKIAVETLRSLEELAARIENAQSDWAAVYVGADFSLAAQDVYISVPLGGDLLSAGISEEEALACVSPLLEKAKCVEVWNAKALPIEACFDVMLAAYVLNPQRRSFAADALCEDEGVSGFAACPALAVHKLAAVQRAQLKEKQLEHVFNDIEMPLSAVLRDMEKEGFLVDAGLLQKMGASMDETIARLMEEIDGEFGAKINLNSPKQLGEMLFEKMKLPAPKKTKSGYSTSAEVLEGLAEDFPVCAKILEYRKYTKLRSTYIDSLIQLRDENGRVHTHFDQVATATGRLSSMEPNLQNIPVRTELGREIRGAFIARPGWVLVDADYSQIELRVLAHISGDETMISAFNAGEDIHARTAAEVYGVPLGEVTGQMRSASKAVNFGIVYGISDFALAKNIGVSRTEARDFMNRYFERYPGVKAYMEDSVAEARSRGYAITLMGRRRYIPELTSPSFNLRAFGERCAMNSPIQGTAADIIKIAMNRVAAELKKRGMRTRLILQVHDELILEAPEEEAEEAAGLLRSCMEGVMELKVPLRTDITTGGDWRACK